MGEEKIVCTELKTAPIDPRFPGQNQTRYCFNTYLDFHRCQKIRGETYEPCQYYKNVFNKICPKFWIEKWDDQRAEGVFPGNI